MFNLKQYKKKWYSENKERISNNSSIKYQKNKEWICERRRIQTKLLRENDPEKYQKRLDYYKKWREENEESRKMKLKSIHSRYSQYRVSSNRRGHKFSLDEDSFSEIMNGNCYYCGVDRAWGIDRKNNKLGYTKENSVPCCAMCNKLKWRWTEQQFKDQIIKIYNHIQK